MAADPVPSPCRVVRHRAARRLTLRVSRAGARLTTHALDYVGRRRWTRVEEPAPANYCAWPRDLHLI